MPVSLDDFPKPNPFFGVPYPFGRWRGMLARCALALFWLAAFGALSGLLIGVATRENSDLAKYPLITFVFSAAAAPCFLFVYRRYEVGYRFDSNDIVPAQVEQVMRVRPAAAALGLAALLGGSARIAVNTAMGIAGVRVTYVSGGRQRRVVAMIDTVHLGHVTPGRVLWITRPSFLLHCIVVDKILGLGCPQAVAPDAYRWFVAARRHAA